MSEILDWIEANGTVDAWILTGLEQHRTPSEVGSTANLEVGRGAIRSVIKAALAQDDEAWSVLACLRPQSSTLTSSTVQGNLST